MSSHGLWKTHHAIGKSYAIKDWQRVARYAIGAGKADLAEKHKPQDGFGTHRIDDCTECLMTELGLSWNDVANL